MKKFLIAMVLVTTTNLLSTTSVLAGACPDGGCPDTTVNQQQDQGLTNSNSPTFNSQPTMAMAGSNVAIQQMNDSYTRLGDTQCPNATLNVTGYGGRTRSENNFNNYGTDGTNVGAHAGISVPLGKTVSNCKKGQAQYLADRKFDAMSKLVRMCMDMTKAGIQISDQLKGTKGYEQFKICDHFRKMKQESPQSYNVAVQQVNLATAVPVKHVKVVKKLVGYKSYRIRFQDVSTCADTCNSNVSLMVKRIKKIKLEKEQIYLVPYGNSGKISLYVRGGYLTQAKAEEELMKYYEQGIPARVVGVAGTEIYK